MAGVGKPLRLRLFLEGQEVPVISAQVQAGIWAPAAASIQVVPLDSALDLKPRTMVHLFYLEEPSATESGRASLSDLSGSLGDEAYKLFFCGEFVGFSFVKTPMSRAVVLQCIDFSSYWDSLQATMMDYGPQGNAFVSRGSLYASNEALFASVPTQGEAEKLRYWILGKAQTPGLENVGGLAGGILNMIEVMGGLRGHTLGVNDFFTLAEIRCHLLAQIAAEDGDNTAQNLLDISVFFDWIFNNLQNQPGQVSLRDMMKLLCSYIYYSFVPNPVAKFELNDKKTTKVYSAKDVALASHPYFVGCLSIIQKSLSVLNPVPDLEDISATKKVANDYWNLLIPRLKEMTSKGAKRELVDMATLAQQKIYEVTQVFASKGKVEPGLRRETFNMAQKLHEEFQSASKSTVQQSASSKTFKETSKLRTQIFRPDCYMAAPPTCNVIFPEQYSQMTYDRSFINEVTRVGLFFYPHIVGQDALLAQQFIEPHLLDASAAVAKVMKNQYRVLMDHELHTGIIAREEWLPDSFGHLRQPKGDVAAQMKQAGLTWVQRTGLHHFFKYRIGPRTMSVAGRFMPNLVVGFPGLVIQKPFHIADSSGVEDDKFMIDMITNATNSVDLGAPPQFLGLIEGVSHSLGQEGGSTNASFSHCRSHLGIDDEFVGKVLDRVRTSTGVTEKIWYTLSYDKVKGDEKLRNFLLGCTPQSPPAGDATSATLREVTANEAEVIFTSYERGKPKKVTKKVQVKASSESKTKGEGGKDTAQAQHPYDAAGKQIYVPSTPGEITVGGKGLYGGKVTLIEVNGPYTVVVENGKRYFRNITVFESVTTKVTQDSPVPVEYVVQPAWLSTSYDNENVGPKVYQPFFGCDSIVDMLSAGNMASIPERLNEKGMYVTTKEDQKAIEARLKDYSSKRNFYSIERAVNLLSFIYGRVKKQGSDVTEFVETFTKRPVATKKDLLGSYDLQVVVKGGALEATKGTMGFHTASVHEAASEAGNLTGLLDNPAIQMSRMNSSQKQAMQASYDVRKEKLAKVKEYVASLRGGAQGFVG